MAISIRLAGVADVQSLVDLRCAFLAEVSDSGPLEQTLVDAISAYFSRALPAGEFIAYLAEVHGEIVATSGLTYHRQPPSPQNPHGCEAYILNMYTRPAWRRRGIASALLQKLIDHARRSNSCRVSLHSLPDARSIYLKAGFVPVDAEMRLEFSTRRND
jgi:GNAT superfamily N-acetyltransferase